jgi:predicted transcriptional regulator
MGGMSEKASKQAAVFENIVTAFKSVLKERGLTYKDLAAKLEITEGAVKKSLSSDDMCFSRMIEFCDAAEVSYYEMVRRADGKQEQRIYLTDAQESLFVSDLCTWKFFMDLLEMPLDQVRDKHELKSDRIELYLGRLAQVGLLERKGAYGYKFLFEGRLVSWNPNGEFARTFNKKISTHLMGELFSQSKEPGSTRTRASVRMKPETRDELIERFEALSSEMAARGRREMSVYDQSKLIDVTWVLGVKEFDVWAFLLDGLKL